MKFRTQVIQVACLGSVWVMNTRRPLPTTVIYLGMTDLLQLRAPQPVMPMPAACSAAYLHPVAMSSGPVTTNRVQLDYFAMGCLSELRLECMSITPQDSLGLTPHRSLGEVTPH